MHRTASSAGCSIGLTAEFDLYAKNGFLYFANPLQAFVTDPVLCPEATNWSHNFHWHLGGQLSGEWELQTIIDLHNSAQRSWVVGSGNSISKRKGSV
jgi:hypothetical protein